MKNEVKSLKKDLGVCYVVSSVGEPESIGWLYDVLFHLWYYEVFLITKSKRCKLWCAYVFVFYTVLGKHWPLVPLCTRCLFILFPCNKKCFFFFTAPDLSEIIPLTGCGGELLLKPLIIDCCGLALFLNTFFPSSPIVCVPRPQHQLSKPGELRQEYEAEISKVNLKIYS